MVSRYFRSRLCRNKGNACGRKRSFMHGKEKESHDGDTNRRRESVERAGGLCCPCDMLRERE
jgi:hypothetical protein